MSLLPSVSHPGAGAAITVCPGRKRGWVWWCDTGSGAGGAAAPGGFADGRCCLAASVGRAGGGCCGWVPQSWCAAGCSVVSVGRARGCAWGWAVNPTRGHSGFGRSLLGGLCLCCRVCWGLWGGLCALLSSMGWRRLWQLWSPPAALLPALGTLRSVCPSAPGGHPRPGREVPRGWDLARALQQCFPRGWNEALDSRKLRGLSSSCRGLEEKAPGRASVGPPRGAAWLPAPCC